MTPRPALRHSPWHRRSANFLAAALLALFAGVVFVVSGSGERTFSGYAGTSTPRSANFSPVATDHMSPESTAPPQVAPVSETLPTAASRTDAPPSAAPPAPAPPPPPELKLWYGDARSDAIPAFVAISNNADQAPVSCVYTAVAVAGPGTAVNYTDTVNFTVSGSAETRLDRPGPATGTTWHVTVTCSNGLSTSQEHTY